MAMMQAVARRLGLPQNGQPGQEPQFMPAGEPQMQYPALSYAQGIDRSISPRPQRLPMLPRAKMTENAGVPYL